MLQAREEREVVHERALLSRKGLSPIIGIFVKFKIAGDKKDIRKGAILWVPHPCFMKTL